MLADLDLSDIYNYHHGNITPVLIVWFVFGLIGLGVAFFNLHDARADAKALVANKDRFPSNRAEELLMVARASVRNEYLRLFKMSCVIGTAIAAGLSTPAISDEVREQHNIPYWTPVGVAIVVMLLSIVGVTVAQSILDLRVRHSLYRRGTPNKEG